MPRWATKHEAAEYIRLRGPDLIAQAVKDGDLPAYSIGKGRDYRLDLDDVDEWLKSNSHIPRSA
ncbi:excisionase family DNA-binding protein [Mycolicibacterium llatzerense]|uniref:excisionase family DNA-binding protein n=1 Tax=Mycolicibacterium llatzerense TaxID=280871 RepID=UPI0036F26BCD|nr:hypothetical protein [Mycolicibacterium llatzerense]